MRRSGPGSCAISRVVPAPSSERRMASLGRPFSSAMRCRARPTYWSSSPSGATASPISRSIVSKGSPRLLRQRAWNCIPGTGIRSILTSRAVWSLTSIQVRRWHSVLSSRPLRTCGTASTNLAWSASVRRQAARAFTSSPRWPARRAGTRVGRRQRCLPRRSAVRWPMRRRTATSSIWPRSCAVVASFWTTFATTGWRPL